MSEILHAHQSVQLAAQKSLEDEFHLEWQRDEVLEAQLRAYINAKNQKTLSMSRHILVQLLLARGAILLQESLSDETAPHFTATTLDAGAKDVIGRLLQDAPDMPQQMAHVHGRRKIPWVLERYGQFDSLEPIPGNPSHRKRMQTQSGMLVRVPVYRGHPYFKEMTDIQLQSRRIEPHK